MSETTFGRIERGVLPNVTVRQLSTACAAVGLKFTGRPYPDGDPVRDSAHAHLLERLHVRMHKRGRWRTEVLVTGGTDSRAWDAHLVLEGVPVAIEAEMRLTDIQALDRKIALKQRDSGVDIVILLVADTVGNRRVLAAHRESLRARFPLDTPAVLAALAAGHAPSGSGIVIL